MNVRIDRFLFLRSGGGRLASWDTDSYSSNIVSDLTERAVEFFMSCVEQDEVGEYHDDHQNKFEVYRVTIVIVHNPRLYPLF